MKHIQGHKVKHSYRNTSAADCSISLKFGAEFHQVTVWDDILQTWKVYLQRVQPPWRNRPCDCRIGLSLIIISNSVK